ncbi:M6 family metalloprotease domain-containing protein [Streptomyces sp. NPDC056528]|uniref:M6 family metalloprotease domain-containing protein n=1 Tax=Streptomyces sp. NPDC056528 TaxID=3345854 RepID=UPI003685BEF7
MSRFRDPEVDVRGQQPPGGGGRRPRLRAGAAAFTSLAALAATGLVAGPAVGVPAADPCALPRTGVHHSLGLDTWNGSYPRPDRALDAVMIFLSFPDSEPLVPPAELAADHFPGTSEFFARASYGRFTLTPHARTTWTPMPRESGAYDIRRDWDAGKRAEYLRDAIAAADADVDFSRYDVVYLVADPDAPGVDSDATKVVNLERPLEADGTEIERVVTVFERHPPDRNVLAHETGHVFDLPDLYHRPEDGKGDWDTHVGDWDVMGSQFGLSPDLFAWHKWKLGWLSRAQVACVQGPASRVVALEPADAPAGDGATLGTRLAVVRTGPDSVLAIEARSDAGNNTETCAEGVLVYRVRGGTASGNGPVEVVDAHPRTEACWERSVYPPLADAPLEEGETFTVPGTGVRVEVMDRSASDVWTVRVTPTGGD